MKKALITGVILGILAGYWLFSPGDGVKEVHNGDSALATPALAQETTPVTDSGRQLRETPITRAVAKVSPAVVGINVLQVRRYVQKAPFIIDDPLWRAIMPDLFRDRIIEQRVKALGSGFLISADGYIVTNEHVVHNAVEVVVTMTDGTRHQAEIVGTDWVTDIALLKIEGEQFPFIPMGNSDDLLVGEWSIALGNPFGLFELSNEPIVTVGVISAIHQDWGRTEDGRLYLDMIQTSAAINHGNSGGPLVNVLGEVIGVNTFIYTGSQYNEGFVGIGFAIPINKVKEIITEIREKGGINRDWWLGILKVQDVNPFMMAALGLAVDYGAIIAQIERRSPAYRAGLRAEDVIIALNGKTIRSADDLIHLLENMDLKVGDRLTFTVMRGKQKLTITVTLEAMKQ